MTQEQSNHGGHPALAKIMRIPFGEELLTIEYDARSYAPTAHTTLLQIYNFSIDPGDRLGAVIGTGSGLDAIAMVKKGMPKVVATDLDAYTLAVAMHNASLNGVLDNIDFRLGNMFEPLEEYIKQGEYFDAIFSSLPCFPVPPDKEDAFPSYVNGGPTGTKYLVSTLENGADFLHKPNGRLYINFGSTSDPKKLFSLLDGRYNWRELARINLPFSEQFMQIWHYMNLLCKQGKAEIWEEHGVPYRWYVQIEAKGK